MPPIAGKKPAPPASVHLAGGAVSGLASCVLLQPFDVIKTRLQQAVADDMRRCTAAGAAAAAGPRQGGLPIPAARAAGFRTLAVSGQINHVVRQVLAERGVVGLWRGTAPTIMRNVPGSAFYFLFLHQLRSAMAQVPAIPKDTVNMVSGAVARGVAGFLLMPMSVIKVRYESSAYAYTSVMGATRDIVAREGVKGLFAGFGATAMRDVPYAGVYVALYEQCKQAAHTSESLLGTASPAIVNMGSGIAAGFLATCITQPFDLLKTRVQVSPTIYRNLFFATRKVLVEEGIRGFFAGMSARLLRKPLHAAITWTVYEEAVSLLTTRWREPSEL